MSKMLGYEYVCMPNGTVSMMSNCGCSDGAGWSTTPHDTSCSKYAVIFCRLHAAAMPRILSQRCDLVSAGLIWTVVFLSTTCLVRIATKPTDSMGSWGTSSDICYQNIMELSQQLTRAVCVKILVKFKGFKSIV